MPNVSGELRDIFQMACFSRGMTFLTRLHSQSDGLMVSQNVKRTTFEKVPKVFSSQIHGQKFPTEGTALAIGLCPPGCSAGNVGGVGGWKMGEVVNHH